MTYVEEHIEILNDEQTQDLDRLIANISPIIGQRILEAWKFPPGLAIVPTHYLDYMRDSEATDYVDVVTVASLQSHGPDADNSDVPAWDQIPAFAKVGLDVNEESLEMDQLHEEITLVANVLQ